ncbi:hypothetical protein BsWGS_07075 [Bradybaena similaris]
MSWATSSPVLLSPARFKHSQTSPAQAVLQYLLAQQGLCSCFLQRYTLIHHCRSRDKNMAALRSAILLLLPIVTLAQVTLRPSNEMSLELFHDVDRNSDGQVNRDEVDYFFLAFDFTGDGAISQHEFSQHIFTHYPDLSSYDSKLYSFFDFDNDKHLTHVDFDNLFSQIDSNGNGIVSQAEFLRYFNVIFDSLG